MYSLKDKVAVITGSGRGIGRAIALRLAKEGSKVVVNAKKRKEEMEETMRLVKEKGADTIGVLSDVSTKEGCSLLLTETKKVYGGIDILINNAGLGLFSLFMSADDKLIQKQVETDFLSVVYCSQVFAREMNKGGAIVNISSLAGLYPLYGLSIYGAMKGAVISLTRYLAVEFAPRLRVNAIAPGFVKTKLGESIYQLLGVSEEEFAKRYTLMGKILEPEEVAEVVVALLKVESLTGQVITIESGESLRGSVP